MRSTRRTTLRTAAVLAGAAAVLALPVGSAFADSPAVPEPEALPGIEQPSVDPSVEPSVEPPVEPSVDPSVPPVTPPVTPPTKPQVKPEVRPEVRAYVTTVKLADGSVAKVYKIGDNHFEADIFAGSTKLDTLVSTGGGAAYGQSNGLHVVLQPNGTVTSWMEGAERPKPVEKPKPQIKPEAKKESSVRVTLPDGRIAKLVDGANGKRVEISTPKGTSLGTIDLKHPGTRHDGWTYKLVQDGKRVKFVVIDGRGGGNSWVYDFDGKLIEKYTVDPAKKDVKKDAKDAKQHVTKDDTKPVVGKVVPKGGVKAGAEGVAPSNGDTPALVAAGGGMAAVGAAGLGFAMLRRNRTEGEG
ncbi:hypothetical protein ACGFYQ_18090 [Streptomyces sp. NPDC048258]|uniref:hypothetical protein n=1 Tax=Streptomyces sp. NPDC048258 TaxID=3365527 RepID=UPI0037231AB2